MNIVWTSISIGTVIKNSEMSEFLPDQLKF